MKVKYDGECCSDCAEMLANGTCADGSYDDAHDARMLAHLGTDLAHACLGDETTEFSWSRCDACGSRLGGSRHAFSVLEPEATRAPIRMVIPNEPFRSWNKS